MELLARNNCSRGTALPFWQWVYTMWEIFFGSWEGRSAIEGSSFTKNTPTKSSLPISPRSDKSQKSLRPWFATFFSVGRGPLCKSSSSCWGTLLRGLRLSPPTLRTISWEISTLLDPLRGLSTSPTPMSSKTSSRRSIFHQTRGKKSGRNLRSISRWSSILSSRNSMRKTVITMIGPLSWLRPTSQSSLRRKTNPGPEQIWRSKNQKQES